MTSSQSQRESSQAEGSRCGAQAMAGFSAPAQCWFLASFQAPTRAQAEAWQAIGSGKNVLVVAPTGSGKTLAAFLWALDRLAADPDREPGVKIVYVSPLKALGVDVERNLRAPLAGLREASRALGLDAPSISVGVRSGDTPARERRRLLSHPPDILITTPESLYLMLTSKGAQTLKNVQTVIVDEVHALAGNKRGAHLALSLERLDLLLDQPAQRIGLSATVEPVGEVARFLGGSQAVDVVRPPSEKQFDIIVEVPAPDMTDPPVSEREMVNANSSKEEYRLRSMWPSIEASLFRRIMGANSTIVFTNSRRQAERLTTRLNELYAQHLAEAAERPESPSDQRTGSVDGTENLDETPVPDSDGPVLARSHHGSVSKEARARVEDDLKSGRLRCVVATASLELGIDMGQVDLVVQIDPPPSVASGLQRLGRSGHQVGGASSAVFYPTHRSKLLETAVIVHRMRLGQIEALHVTSNPLDVLAQQTIAQAVAGPLNVDQWYTTVRRAAPFRDLPRSAFISVLDLISGKYPSTEFASLRARVDWDRRENLLTPRPGALRLAVTNGGTIPDRGLYRVVVGSEQEGSTRVGELDEEMVYETRVGEVFTLGTTSWRVRQITKDTVEVEPAFGVVARTPFWRGDSLSRPIEVGHAMEALVDRMRPTPAAPRDTAGTPAEEDGLIGGVEHFLLAESGFDRFAVDNALAYLHEQEEAVGRLPNPDTLLVERTRDDVGDWLLILHSPLGLAVHAPWALAINARLRQDWGLEGKAVPSNDGIIVRLPDFDSVDDSFQPNPPDLLELAAGSAASAPQRMPTAAEIFLFEPETIAETVRQEVQNSAVFAARFREASARALILGSSKPGKRSPLWQQRLRASALLEVAEKYPDFPMILEALREVIQDVYDVDALAETMSSVARRQRTLVEVDTEVPSPFARSLLFGYVGEFIYSGDVPAGERRVAALSVDPQVLRELLGEVSFAELLEDRAVAEVESELQRTKAGWQARGADGVVDLLRALGPLTRSELALRVIADSGNTDEVETEGEVGSANTEAIAGGDLNRLIGEAMSSRRIVLVRMGGEDFLSAVEDAGLLAAAAGVVSPAGVASVFLERPQHPVRELLTRHLNSNVPFVAEAVAARFGIAVSTVVANLRELEESGHAVRGRFVPEENTAARGWDATAEQWVAPRVLDRLRTRSLAMLRGSVEPVPQAAFAQFLGAWQSCDGRLRGTDGLYTCLEQLERLPLPASAWETLVLPLRVGDYRPAMLDTLVVNGEVTWVGSGPIGSRDGWVEFVPSGVPARLNPRPERQRSTLEEAILEELRVRGALFAPALLDGLISREVAPTARDLSEAIWSLVWDGLITSDSVSALRAHISGTKAAQKTVRARPRGRSLTRMGTGNRTSTMPVTGVNDPSLVGRWSLVGRPDPTPSTGPALSSEEATLWAVEMLERYAVVTRGSVIASDFPGGFAQAYRLYSDFEISGTCRRGYFIEGLGAAQFAVPGAVDRLRMVEDEWNRGAGVGASLTLAATDPANPYGAALPWPDAFGGQNGAKRKPGAIVTLVDGRPVLYLERGGRTVWADPDPDEATAGHAARSLVQAFHRAGLATFTIEKINGESAIISAWRGPLLAAGFAEVPRGLTLRRKIR